MGTVPVTRCLFFNPLRIASPPPQHGPSRPKFSSSTTPSHRKGEKRTHANTTSLLDTCRSISTPSSRGTTTALLPTYANKEIMAGSGQRSAGEDVRGHRPRCSLTIVVGGVIQMRNRHVLPVALMMNIRVLVDTIWKMGMMGGYLNLFNTVFQ